MPNGSSQKSSIDFLLSGPPAEETINIGPKKTIRSSTSAKKRQIIRPKNPNFSLKILQQPSHAKVSPRPPSRVFPPFSEHRPIHPPPVLQLRVDDFKFKNDDANFLNDDLLNHLHNQNDPRSYERIEELKIIKEMRLCKIPSWTHYSTFFVTARLQTIKGQNEKILFNNKSEKSIDDLLIGIKVCSGMPISLRTASPANSYLNKSLPGEKPKSSNYAIAFVFSDLSVRKIGSFNLKFDLFEVFQGKIYWRNEIVSDAFTVYTPKKFPGSFPSTALTSFLYKNGARIRQRKRVTTSSNSNSSTRKFDEMEDGQDEDSEYPLAKSSSSASLNKLPPSKLPKLQSLYQVYSSGHHHHHHNHNHHNQPQQPHHSHSIEYYPPPSTIVRSDQPPQPPSIASLPPVGHFHETIYTYPPQPPQFQRMIQPQILPPQQQQPGVYAYPPSARPPPPGQQSGTTTTYVQHIPISTAHGPYFHPPSGGLYQPAIVQHLPPTPVTVAPQPSANGASPLIKTLLPPQPGTTPTQGPPQNGYASYGAFGNQ